MSFSHFQFPASKPLVVGSFGTIKALQNATPQSLLQECDIAEIRLDLLLQWTKQDFKGLWKHLDPFPLLFTARRASEGSPIDLDHPTRENLLKSALDDAALIDIELESCEEMAGLISEMKLRNLPWIASFHDFVQLPKTENLHSATQKALAAGASAFKLAAHLNNVDDLAALAKFQHLESGISKSTMGMGALAPTSRLLCAQFGSVLNYGFIGSEPTAPGQWSARQLKQGIATLSCIATNSL